MKPLHAPDAPSRRRFLKQAGFLSMAFAIPLGDGLAQGSAPPRPQLPGDLQQHRVSQRLSGRCADGGQSHRRRDLGNASGDGRRQYRDVRIRLHGAVAIVIGYRWPANR